MKILAIRGRNLASLENFDVALEEGPLAHVGIFAITGPTGAGKTTLLDALCVALFDRTPRLSNQAGVPVGHVDQDDNQRVRANDVRGLLRRGCGEGFAEVDFMGRDDRSYRARWEVRRARGSASGKLQKTNMSLTCLQTMQVISAAKKTETLKAIETCLGLSYEQFRRSALLAQNDFAAFLRANKDERSELLERMTGTEIYTRVSIAAFRRASEEAKKLELLEDSLDSSAILSDEERELAEAKRMELRGLHKATSEMIKSVEGELRWFGELREADKQIQNATDDHKRAIAAEAALEPISKRMAQVQEARSHRGAIDSATKARAEVKATQASRTLAISKAKVAEASVVSAKRSITANKAAIEIARKEYVETLGLQLKAAHSEALQCDEWLALHSELRAAGGEVEEFVDLAATVLDDLRPDLDEEVTETHSVLRELGKRSEASQNAHKTAKSSASEATSKAADAGIEGLRARAALLRSQSKTLEELVQIAERVRQSGAAQKTALAQRKTSEESAAKLAIVIAQSQAERIVAQIRLTEAEAAHDRIRLALDFKEQRAALRDEESCPLCGSEQHPWKEAGLAESLVGEQHARVSALRESLGELDRGIADASAKKSAAEQAGEQAAQQSQESQNHCHKAMAEYAQHWALASDLSASLEDSSTAGTGDELATLLSGVREALDEQEQRLTRAERLEVVAREATAQAQKTQTDWERVREEVQEAERELTASRNRMAACDGYRYRARKDQSYQCQSKIVGLETRLGAAEAHVFPNLEAELRASTQSHQDSLGEQVASQVRVQSAQQQHEQAEGTQALAQLGLDEVLRQLACTESELAEHLAVDDLWLKESQTQLAQAATRCVEARATVQERSARRAQLAKTQPPALSEEATRQRQETLVVELDNITEQGVSVRAQLEANIAACKRRSELGLKIDKAHERVKTYKILSDLIGSADGKKFRVFAQSLTLDTLLAGANQHLRDLAPRYALQRVPGHDLDIQVIDRDLANDVRSVNSLSGGESFLMSLALALGLSSLASRDIRVESLLVDEGFGSLDEETLEVALSVLDSLQATGRKVGLISHVHGFAERIGAQVVVRPIGSGCSRVEIQAGAGLA